MTKRDWTPVGLQHGGGNQTKDRLDHRQGLHLQGAWEGVSSDLWVNIESLGKRAGERIGQRLWRRVALALLHVLQRVPGHGCRLTAHEEEEG